MESLVKSLVCSIIVLWSVTKIDHAYASEECDFPAIFNFGASNADTGGLASAFPAILLPPYGETYFHEPAGRFSDGRLIIDFIANSFDLPYLNAYLDSLGNGFNHGVNFATAASTIRLPSRILPASGGFSPFYLDIQYTQFVRIKSVETGVAQALGSAQHLSPAQQPAQQVTQSSPPFPPLQQNIAVRDRCS